MFFRKSIAIRAGVALGPCEREAQWSGGGRAPGINVNPCIFRILLCFEKIVVFFVIISSYHGRHDPVVVHLSYLRDEELFTISAWFVRITVIRRILTQWSHMVPRYLNGKTHGLPSTVLHVFTELPGLKIYKFESWLDQCVATIEMFLSGVGVTEKEKQA